MTFLAGFARCRSYADPRLLAFPVVGDALVVGVIRHTLRRAPPRAGIEVPPQRHRCDRKVRPPIGDPEIAEVDVPGASTVVADQGVGRAGIAMADHQSIRGWCVGGNPGRRAEWAPIDGQGVVQPAQGFTDRAGGVRGTRDPVRVDGRAPWSAAVCSQPGPAASTRGTGWNRTAHSARSPRRGAVPRARRGRPSRTPRRPARR